MKRLTIVLGVFLLAVSVTGSALAGSRTVRDPRGDTKGSHWPGPGFYWATSGPCRGSWTSKATGSCGENDYFENAGPLLDLTSVAHGHRGSSVTHRLTFTRNVGTGLLSRERGGQISIYFSTDRDAAFERRLDFYVRRGKFAALMKNAAGRTVGSPVVTKPNAKTLQVAFAPQSLGPGVRSYRWFAFSGIRCNRRYDACGDRSAGLVTHALR